MVSEEGKEGQSGGSVGTGESLASLASPLAQTQSLERGTSRDEATP